MLSLSPTKEKAGDCTMFLVKKYYNAVEITAPLTIPNSCDCTIIKVGCLASTLVLIFQPQNCSKEDTLQLLDALECIFLTTKNVTLLGDFNLPGINWLDEPPLAENELSAALVELVSLWDMTQVVCEPSRGENWLDLIITTSPSAYNKYHVHAPVASSDHNLISRVINIPQRIRLNCPNFVCTQKHINYGLLQLKLDSITWSFQLSASTDVNDTWQTFYSVLTEAINSCSSSSVLRSVHVARS